MRLPFAPPLTPMLSSAANALPGGDGWQFEPKWDGFRTLVFRDGAEVLDFEALLLRIHPAASRVKLLAAQSPASFVAWDLLALDDQDLRHEPLATRRERLELVLAHA